MDKNSYKKLLDEALSPLREDIHDLKKDVRTLKVSVITIEKEVKSYADSYKENQRNIKRLDIRLNVAEEKLDIEPPEEQKIPHFV